jgi:hypothetical protein
VAVPEDSLDRGSPISYYALTPGTAVLATGGEGIGAVEKVLYVEAEDVFDGIVIRTGTDLRFLDADQVDRIYERCVITTLTADQAGQLPPPKDGPAVYRVDPAEATGPSLGARLRRRVGKGGWKQRPG